MNRQECRPPWWPENEAWPPRGRSHRWHAGRGRFFRRAAAVAVIVLMLSVCGALALAWLVATRLGLAASSDQRAAVIVVAGGMAGVALAILTLLRVTRRVAIPLGGVMEAADRVAGGDYGVRVTEQGPPPIRALARAFNTMTERLQNHDRLRRDLMADLAHELRTPLTVIQGRLEGLLDGVYPRDAQQLRALLEETHVLSRLVDDLRTLALAESGALKLQKESIDVASLARDAVAAFGGDAAARGVTLDVDAAAGVPPIEIDPVRIREVMTNLLSNALRHTPAGGSVHVRVSESQSPNPESRITIEVHDTGSGMTPEELAHAFDRFYKGTGSRGSGLGLTIAKNLIAAHGGEIHASSEPQRGTTIAFTLPREP
jgi:two-component system OmpR family sensor kinase/two-component system sensor histidine kinase BaeS